MRKKNKKSKKIKDKIPREFKGYFWDVDFNKLSMKRYPEFILERVMRYGNLRALRWLLAFPKDKIMEVVKKSRELDSKTRNFWQVVYGE